MTITDDAPEPPVTWRSASQFGTFVRCGESYRLERVALAPKRPAAWFAQGTAVHTAIEFIEISGRQASPKEIVERYEAAWDSEIEAMTALEPDVQRWMTGGRTKPEHDIATRHERGRNQALAYTDYIATAPERVWEFTDGEFAVEVPFSIELGGITVLGKIDQLVVWPDGSMRVRDIKTGNRAPDSTLQLGMYDLAVEELFGFRPGWGDYFMCKNNAPLPPADLSFYTRERLTRWITNMDRAVRLGLFVPNVGDHCRVCLVSDYCDAGGSKAHEFPAPNPEPVERRPRLPQGRDRQVRTRMQVLVDSRPDHIEGGAR